MNKNSIIAIIALTSFYLFIALLTLRPQVTEDYRSYYITRQSNLSPWYMKRLRSHPININTTYLHDSGHILFTPNWNSTRAQHNLQRGESGTLYFWIGETKSLKSSKCLIIQTDRPNNKIIAFSLNENTLSAASIIENSSISAFLDSSILKSGPNALRVSSLHESNPEKYGDSSSLIIGVQSLRISDSCSLF